jgi:hypothetical protein
MDLGMLGHATGRGIPTGVVWSLGALVLSSLELAGWRFGAEDGGRRWRFGAEDGGRRWRFRWRGRCNWRSSRAGEALARAVEALARAGEAWRAGGLWRRRHARTGSEESILLPPSRGRSGVLCLDADDDSESKLDFVSCFFTLFPH